MAKPEIDADEILVATLTVGIDATDIEINKGAYGQAPDGSDTLIPGHEAVGLVVAAGPRAEGFSPGDTVVPTVRRNARKPDDFHERGIKGANGFLAEFFKESPENLVKIPSELAPIGALIEPLSIAEKAVGQSEKLAAALGGKAETTLVLGAGALGLLAAIVLRARGRNAFVYDRAAEESPKARIAAALGAGYIAAGRPDLAEFAKTFGPPDLIIEATGSTALIPAAVETLNRGGILALLSVTSGKHRQEFCLDCFNNRVVLGGRVVFGSVSSDRHHFEAAVETAGLAQAKWPGVMDSVITDRLDPARYKEAFGPRSPDSIKTVIDWRPI